LNARITVKVGTEMKAKANKLVHTFMQNRSEHGSQLLAFVTVGRCSCRHANHNVDTMSCAASRVRGWGNARIAPLFARIMRTEENENNKQRCNVMIKCSDCSIGVADVSSFPPSSCVYFVSTGAIKITRWFCNVDFPSAVWFICGEIYGGGILSTR